LLPNTNKVDQMESEKHQILIIKIGLLRIECNSTFLRSEDGSQKTEVPLKLILIYFNNKHTR
jgi:hypothetical protein